jgi:hydrogenase maturation factor
VIVHAGFAISRLDEAEAEQVFDYLDQIGEAEETLREEGAKPA